MPKSNSNPLPGIPRRFAARLVQALALGAVSTALAFSVAHADGMVPSAPVVDAPIFAPVVDPAAVAPAEPAAAAEEAKPAEPGPELFEKAATLKNPPAPAATPAATQSSIAELSSGIRASGVGIGPDEGAVAGFVPPERTVQVAISRRDLNRIHCPVEVADVFFSQEKRVTIKVNGADVYVKVERKVVDGKFDDSEKPEVIDLHVVCGDAVYTMLLQPVDIDSVTLRLGDPLRSKVAAVAKEWGALPTEEKVQRLTRLVFRDELPVSFTKSMMTSDRRAPRLFRNLIIQGRQRVTAPGLGLAALEYEVMATEPIRLDERDFLDVGLSKSIVGVTVDPLVLDRDHRKARLIIVERSLSDGR